MEKLSSKQRMYVNLEVDNKYHGYALYTNELMAKMCGVDVRTIYRWKHNETIKRVIMEEANYYKRINNNIKIEPFTIDRIRFYLGEDVSEISDSINELLKEYIDIQTLLNTKQENAD